MTKNDNGWKVLITVCTFFTILVILLLLFDCSNQNREHELWYSCRDTCSISDRNGGRILTNGGSGFQVTNSTCQCLSNEVEIK